MRIFPLLHWALSGAGMILLLRSLGISASGSWIGAVTYVFSGVGVSLKIYTNHHPGVCLLPWIVWSVARPTSLRGRIFGSSILLGLDFLAGDLFTIAIGLGAALLWVLLETGVRVRPAELAALGA